MKSRYKYVLQTDYGRGVSYWHGRIGFEGKMYYTKLFPYTDEGQMQAHNAAVELKKRLRAGRHLRELKPYLNSELYGIVYELVHNERDTSKTDDEVRIIICDIVCNSYNVSMKELKSPSRSHKFAIPRQIIMYLLRKHTNLSLTTIAHRFFRHHTTAMHNIELIETRMQVETDLAETIKKLETRIAQRKYL